MMIILLRNAIRIRIRGRTHLEDVAEDAAEAEVGEEDIDSIPRGGMMIIVVVMDREPVIRRDDSRDKVVESGI